jgi:HK97 family phage major capsid protein
MCEDAELQLQQLNSDGASTSLFYTPRGAFGNALPLLAGAPVLAVEQASPLGTVGDIMLCDFANYTIVQSPLQSALSADAAFLTDETIFRFTLRVDGASSYASPVTPFNGGATRSPFITLAAR